MLARDRNGYVFRVTGTVFEGDSVDHRPDLAMYAWEDHKYWKPTEDDMKTCKLPEVRKKHIARTSYATMALVVEVKWNDSAAFGFGNTENVLPASEDNLAARAQYITHVSELFRRQHRLHVFSIHVKKCQARLAFWDRAGVAVTEVIDLQTDSGLRSFLEFILVVSTKMDNAMLGYNPSAVRVTDAELKPMRSFQHPIPAIQNFVTDILQNEQEYPIYKVK